MPLFQEAQMTAGGGPPAPAPAEGGGAQSAVEGIGAMQQALNNIFEGAKGSGMPPEAVQALDVSRQAFDQFVQIISGGAPPTSPGTGQAPAEAGGNPNAVPV